MFTVIIQARMGASRLPGKVLLPLPAESDKTVLDQVYARVHATQGVGKIIIATTDSPADDALAQWLANRGYETYRGSESDVLSRYYHAAKNAGAENIVRITSDCPCLDSQLLSDMIDEFKKSGADYLSNFQPRSFPHGLDAEIFTFAALERAFKEDNDPASREHVTPYIYRSGKFQCRNYLNLSYRMDDEKIRVTLDTPQDYALLLAVYDLLGENFQCADICAIFDKYKWLKMINESIIQKKLYNSAAEELTDAISLLEKQDMKNAAEILKAEMKNREKLK